MGEVYTKRGRKITTRSTIPKTATFIQSCYHPKLHNCPAIQSPAIPFQENVLINSNHKRERKTIKNVQRKYQNLIILTQCKQNGREDNIQAG